MRYLPTDSIVRSTIWAVRTACLLYLTALTFLLLVPNPLAWLWGLESRITPPHRGVHFCAFFLLAVLGSASRLPWKVATLATVLVVYALATESLQSLVENRVVELIDYAENLLGLTVGMFFWALVHQFVVRRYAVALRDSEP